jgi:5-methylcytosine-specific restriction endonuclease McrA
MPIRLCSTPGCPHPAAYRGRCTQHAHTNRQRTHRPENQRIYNTKRWRVLRRAILFTQPLCACGCGHIATDVDHITPLHQGGAPFDPVNLQPLTQACHSRKTRAEQQ